MHGPVSLIWRGEHGWATLPCAPFQTCSLCQSGQRTNRISTKENHTPTPLEDGLECLASLYWGLCCQGDARSQRRGIVKALSLVWWSWMSQVHCWELLCSAADFSLPVMCHSTSKLCFQTIPGSFYKWSEAAVNDWKWQILMSPAFGLGTSDLISIKNFVVIQGQS